VGIPYTVWQLNPLSLNDPIVSLVFSNLGQGLLRIKNAKEVEPDICASFAVSENADLWQVALPTKASFSNGNPLLASDIKRSFEFYQSEARKTLQNKNTEKENPAVPSRVISSLLNIAEIKIIESSAAYATQALEEKLEFKLKNSDLEFGLNVLTLPVLETKSGELFGSSYLTGTNVIAAGPYLLSSNRPREGVILSSSTTTGSTNGYSESIELRFFDDAQAALSALRVGAIDVIAIPTAKLIESAEKDPTLKVVTSPYQTLGLIYGEWQLPKSHWSDPQDQTDLLTTKSIIARKSLNFDAQALVRFNLAGSYLP
jgi:ABC-type transport system substrate-binding protein